MRGVLKHTLHSQHSALSTQHLKKGGCAMFFTTKTRVRQHERGLWFRHGDFRRLLRPGAYRFWGRRRNKVEVVSTLATKFEHPLLDVLLAHAAVRDELHVVDLTESERALVWKDNRLAHVLGPGRHALWKAPYRLYVETFAVDTFRFEHPRLQAILQHPEATRWLEGVQVEAGAEVLLFRDCVLLHRLPEGLHVFWKGTGKVRWVSVDRREQVADVAGQEIMTADKVTLRVNL